MKNFKMFTVWWQVCLQNFISPLNRIDRVLPLWLSRIDDYNRHNYVESLAYLING